MFKKCASDKALVVFDRKGKIVSCTSGKAVFVPFFRRHGFLYLSPLLIILEHEKFPTKEKVNLILDAKFTIGISNDSEDLKIAAQSLYGKTFKEIIKIGKDIICEQLKAIVANDTIEKINNNRERFLESILDTIKTAFRKLGLRLISISICDINDDGGILDAIYKEAAIKAIEEAKRKIAVINKRDLVE